MGDLTKNFSTWEVKCNCGRCSGLPTDPRALEYFIGEVHWLQLLRDAYGKPIHLSSGYRCPEYNSSVSNTGATGPHTRAAFDILVSGRNAFYIVSAATRLGASGIGVSQKGPHESRFIHVDRDKNDMRPWLWSY